MATAKIVEGLRGIGVALLDALKGIVAGPEDEPPVGAQDTFGYPTIPGAVPAAGGGLILLILLAVLLFRK